jgi:hypothetical protein
MKTSGASSASGGNAAKNHGACGLVLGIKHPLRFLGRSFSREFLRGYCHSSSTCQLTTTSKSSGDFPYRELPRTSGSDTWSPDYDVQAEDQPKSYCEHPSEKSPVSDRF